MNSSIYSFLCLSVGASCGASLRWGLGLALGRWFPGVPMGTFAANAIGCLLAGAVLRWSVDWTDTQRLLVQTGFLGALTTFSTFSVELMTCWHERKILLMMLHWFGGAVVCLVACCVGYWVASRVAL